MARTFGDAFLSLGMPKFTACLASLLVCRDGEGAAAGANLSNTSLL